MGLTPTRVEIKPKHRRYREMKKVLFSIPLLILFLCACTTAPEVAPDTVETDSIIKIEMHLSAMGVESDDFPNINVTVDFQKDSNRCHKWYFHPDKAASTYVLSKEEMQSILKLLKISDLEKLKEKYTVNMTDQATSTTTIYTTKTKFVIKDYGLRGEYPLQPLYKIVYRYW